MTHEEERNYCPRCGKRLGKSDWDVHTCTPPQENPAPCARHCEANAFQIVIKNLKAQLAQPEQEEKLPPVEIGVDVTDIGTTVVAFYRRPNAVMEMFYSQFHPLAQPEQEPVAIKRMKEWIEYLKRKSDHGQHMKIPSEMSAGTCWELAIELEQFINTTPPQRKPLTDEDVERFYAEYVVEQQNIVAFARAIEAAHNIKEKKHDATTK